VAIPGYQFIKKMRQIISIRYVSMRMAINFIKNTRIGTLKIMHLFREGQLLRRLLIGIISGTGSHEPRTWDTASSHAQLLRHCFNILPGCTARFKGAVSLRAIWVSKIPTLMGHLRILILSVVIAISVYAFYMQFYCHQVTSHYQR
jgi:hypothetical protein